MAKSRVREVSLVARDMAFYADGRSNGESHSPRSPGRASANHCGQQRTWHGPRSRHRRSLCFDAAFDRRTGRFDRVHRARDTWRLHIPLPAARAHDEGCVDSRGIGAARAKARAYEPQSEQSDNPQSAIRTTLSPVSLREAISTPAGKSPVRPEALRHDRRPLRPHHRAPVLRTGSAVEAAADRSRRAARGSRRAGSRVRNGRSRVSRIRPWSTRHRARRHLSHGRIGEGQGGRPTSGA